LVIIYFMQKGFFAENIVYFFGMAPSDSAESLSRKDAIAILDKTSWFGYFDNFLIPCAILYVCSFFAFLYKLWDALPQHRAHMTPIKATMPLLIPGFNCYWVFVSTLRYVKDANHVLRLRNIENSHISPDIAVCMSVSMLLLATLVVIPVVGDIFVLLYMICLCIFASQSCAAAVTIARTSRSHVPDRQPLMERNAPVVSEKSA